MVSGQISSDLHSLWEENRHFKRMLIKVSDEQDIPYGQYGKNDSHLLNNVTDTTHHDPHWQTPILPVVKGGYHEYGGR